jgi:hypothetical protein
VFIIAAGIAILSPNAVNYFEFLGGVSAVPLTVILPTIIFWKVSQSCWKVILITLWSLVLTTLGLISSVKVVIRFDS